MPGYFILDFSNGDFRQILDSFFDSIRVHLNLQETPTKTVLSLVMGGMEG
jgi:hypothetical protein